MVIVAAVDRSDRSERVVAEAQKLGDAFDDEVHVVYSLTRSEFIELGRTSAEKSAEMIDMDEIREIAAEIAAETTEGITGSVHVVGLVGEPGDRIPKYAKEQNARYVVVGPRRRSPTGKAMFGSVAQSILLNAPCPVLTTITQNSK